MALTPDDYIITYVLLDPCNPPREIMLQWFADRFAAGTPTKNINTMSPFLTLANLYEETGDQSYLPYLDSWAEWLMDPAGLPKTEEGGFQHIVFNDENPQELWDDTLMMSVLPLARIGLLLDRPHYVEEAKRQFLVHIKYLTDRKTGLWYHGWTFDGRHNFAGALWARGNCWVTIAIPEIIEMLDLEPGDALRTFLIDTLEAQVKALAQHQDAKCVRDFLHRVGARRSKPERIGLRRDTGEPAVVVDAETLAARRMRDQEAGGAAPIVPRHSHPGFDAERHQEQRGDRRRDGNQEDFSKHSHALQIATPPVVDDGRVLPRDAADLSERGATGVLVKLRVRRRRWRDGDVRSGLGPDHVRASHVIGRADEQDPLPMLALEDRVHELHVLQRITRAQLELDVIRRNALADRDRAHRFRFLEAVDKSRRQNQPVGVTGLIQIERLLEPLLLAAAGLP